MRVPASDIQQIAQMEWVTGFISAFNYYVSRTGDVRTTNDFDGYYAWIDNYCAAHPLDTVANATVALIFRAFQPHRGALKIPAKQLNHRRDDDAALRCPAKCR